MKPYGWIFLMLQFLPYPVFASGGEYEIVDLTTHWAGFAALAIFFVAYSFVIAEEFLHMRKSKPVVLAAGVIWIILAFVYGQMGIEHTVQSMLNHNLLEYVQLLLFLLVAMTYINALQDRKVFEALRTWLINKGFTFRQLFWVTGFLAFFISPVADNLTTALIMGAVILAVGGTNGKFVSLAFINVVVAANAGGAFSPFGDITTLMVWQAGKLGFSEFFVLFLPSLVNFLVPAAIMHFAIPQDSPNAHVQSVTIRKGGFIIMGLFAFTIFMAVSMHSFLHMPPVLGMMTGLSLLMIYSYFIKMGTRRTDSTHPDSSFDIFNQVKDSEWDTLFFFFGVILAVGGLALIGYLASVSQLFYGNLGPLTANILVGLLSAVVDNIPVMFAVLTMSPEMSDGHWLLVTLTAGVGGSLLSVGSAAGVALMGQSQGMYTFFSHIKWIWAIALGYAASIWVHWTLNAGYF